MPYEKIGKNVPVCIADEVPFEIPESWEWVRLGSIGETNIGLTYKPSDKVDDKNGIAVLRSNNIQNGKMEYNDIVYVSCSVPERAMIGKGDILICARNGSRTLVGKSAIVDVDGMAFGAFMAKYTSFLSGKLNPYILTFIESPIFRGQLDGVKTETINQITQKMIKEQLIPIPPLAEQIRINKKLKELMLYVKKYDVAYSEITKLNGDFPDMLRKSILQEAVQGKLVPQDPTDEPASVLLKRIRAEKEQLIKAGKIKRDKHESVIIRRDNSHYEKLDGIERCIDDEIPFEIPESWEWCRLKLVGITQTGNTPSKTHPEYIGDEIPFITPGDIQNGTVFYDNQSLSMEGKMVARVCPKGSILQVCIGGSIGKTAIANKKVCFNQQINSISPIIICNEYIYAIMQSPYFLKNIKKQAGGTATPIINRGIWDSLLIPIAPISEQKRIIEKQGELFDKISLI